MRMNEQRLIRWIRKEAGAFPVPSGIGDDAAVVRASRDKDWLLKTELLVEGVHFDPRSSKEAQWGYKALMCNVSDIAAMGGRPRFALIAVGIPERYSLARAKRIFRGIKRASRLCGVRIVGGDTSRSEVVVLSVSVVGEVDKGKAVTRRGARVGDLIFVTGPLGGSMTSGRHLRFMPRLRESRFLMRHFRPHAMIDVSDGLSKDLGLLASESGVGIRVIESAIPLSRQVSHVGSAFIDGEDFELIFTLGLSQGTALLKSPRPKRLGFVFYPIGRVVRRQLGNRLVDLHGRVKPFPPAKDHHFE